MVFVNTKVWVERVARALERAGFRVGVLSGDVPQKKRETLLGRFQKGQLDILVATDVAARGLHIDGVSHVYNYDLPFDAEDYVHRIGRTARLGAEGDAISFACERYAMSLPDIETFIEQKLPVAAVDADLLRPLPRPARVAAEGEEAGESVSQIFREVREAQAAEAGRHGGGGRGGKPGGGPPRRDGGPSRGPRRDGARPAPHRREEHPVATAAPARPPRDPNAPPRERTEGAPAAPAVARAPAVAAAAGVSRESFLKRVASRVKSWVSLSKD
jgi:ATP-dependent RNA helicase RhlB